jgi:hypothetical protein
MGDFMSNVKDNQIGELEALWASFNTAGLWISPVQARYMVVHHGSLIGKEFRLIIQAAPFVLFPFMTTEQKDIWAPLAVMHWKYDISKTHHRYGSLHPKIGPSN